MPKITLNCCDCLKPRSFFPSEVSGPCARYSLVDGYRCKECWDLKRSGKGKGWNSLVESRLVTIECRSCKKEYNLMRKRVSKFQCSDCKKLERKIKNKKVRKRDRVEVTCPDCLSVRLLIRSRAAMSVTGCCRLCKDKRISLRKIPVDLKCYGCGKVRTVKPSTVKLLTRRDGSNYCRKCGLSNRPTGPMSATWKGGKSFEPYPVEWNEPLRRKIRNRDSWTCALCFTKVVGRKPPVHHIDYNKDNLEIENLITLCLKCHTRTNFNRHLWTPLLRPVAGLRSVGFACIPTMYPILKIRKSYLRDLHKSIPR